jgi:hypothetical protein
VGYLVGISKNSRLLKDVDVPSMLVRKAHQELGEKVSTTYRFQSQAHTWRQPCWVVARQEEGELGPNPRFIISARYDDGFKLYYEQYCARGDIENRITDQQLCLFADRRPLLPSSAAGSELDVRAHPARYQWGKGEV